MSDLILIDTAANGVTTLTLNRADKRNALNIPLLESLVAALESANADDAVRIIVLRGAGKVFCAGLDLKEAGDSSISHHSAELVGRVLELLYTSPKATIAAVQGGAYAGGAGLMSCCDFAIAAANAGFGYPEVRRGLVAGLVMTFLRRQVPERFARELLLTGEIIDADRAVEIGLISRAVPEDDLGLAVDLLITELLKGAPGAIAITKEFYDDLHVRPVREDLDRALGLHIRVRDGGEAQEGMRAFVEKRPPAWQQD